MSKNTKIFIAVAVGIILVIASVIGFNDRLNIGNMFDIPWRHSAATSEEQPLRRPGTLSRSNLARPLSYSVFCADSDGGYNVYKRGEVQSDQAPSNLNIIHDSCGRQNTLVEYVCNERTLMTYHLTCPKGYLCVQGECAQGLTPTPPVPPPTPKREPAPPSPPAPAPAPEPAPSSPAPKSETPQPAPSRPADTPVPTPEE